MRTNLVVCLPLLSLPAATASGADVFLSLLTSLPSAAAGADAAMAAAAVPFLGVAAETVPLRQNRKATRG